MDVDAGVRSVVELNPFPWRPGQADQHPPMIALLPQPGTVHPRRVARMVGRPYVPGSPADRRTGHGPQGTGRYVPKVTK